MHARHVVLAIAYLALSAATVRAQGPTFPPGARIGIVAPAGFVPATGFVGFEDTAAGSAIVIADLPRATYDQMLPTFTPEGMAKGGIQATKPAEPWAVAGGEGRVLRGQQESRGVTYRRWLVLARTGDTAALVSAMVPVATAEAATLAVEAALKTIAFRRPPSLDEQVAALPFRVGDQAGFRPVMATGGLSLILTEGASNKPQAVAQPLVYLIAHASGAQGDPKANADLAKGLFGTTPTLRGIVATRTEETPLASRIEGTAVEAATNVEVDVIQIVRFENGGYMRSVGIWRRGAGYRERFERLAASVAPR